MHVYVLPLNDQGSYCFFICVSVGLSVRPCLHLDICLSFCTFYLSSYFDIRKIQLLACVFLWTVHLSVHI